MNFTKKTIKPMSEVKAEKKAFKLLKRAFYLFIAFLLMTGAFTTYEFVLTHDFQSPITFQNPFPRKMVDIQSPVGSKSAHLIKQVSAEEVKNPFDPESPKGVAWEINKDKFGVEHWDAWELLGFKESGWNPYSINKSSGACGIPQALPCSKMDCEQWDYKCQITWMANYIENRYGNPTKALSFHFEKNWY